LVSVRSHTGLNFVRVCPNIYLDLVFNMKLAIYPRIIADSLFKHKNIIRGSQDLYIAQFSMVAKKIRNIIKFHLMKMPIGETEAGLVDNI
jgi:hypothetical protein